MTEIDQPKHIERADIDEANISTLNVGDLQWGKIEELAAIATEVERLGKQNNKLLEALGSGNDSYRSEHQGRGKTSPTNKEVSAKSGTFGAVTLLPEAREAPKQAKDGPKNKNEAPERPETNKKGARISSSQLHEVKAEAPKITILAPKSENSDLKEQDNDQAGNHTKGRKQHSKADVNPKKSRKGRTIEIGSSATEQADSPAAATIGGPQKAAPAITEPKKAPGFYLGDDGRVRRPDGTFANKVEVRRFNNEQSVDVDEGRGNGGGNLPGLIARSLGQLAAIGSKTPSGAGEQAGEVAGVAAGGSIFLAAKEVSGLARDVKEAAEDRGISSIGDIAPYLKKQLGIGKTDGARAKVESRRPPKQLSPGEQAKSALASQQGKQAAQLKASSENQLKQAEVQHDEVIKKLGEVIEAVKPQGPSLIDSAFDMAGDMGRRGKRGSKGRASRSRHQPKMATVRAGMGKAMPALPAVSSAAGRSAGAAVMGGAAAGRLAGAGARAIPIVGQAIALGLAAYDGYGGYNDKDAQTRAFDLKGSAEASTGQKSAMAAARVLDLGGLTSGAAGLVGTAAGAMGFQKIQEAMTFDSDDMAKAIYEGMSLFSRKNPEDKARVGNVTINNMGGGVTPRGITGTTGGWKGTPLKFNGTEAENGLPAGYLAATTAVESGGDPNARNKSGAAGLFQFMPDTAAGLNLKNPYDPQEATKAMIVHTKQNQAYFEKTMGRAPEGRELYLMHQQGMGGGTKLLKNPNALAADVLNSKKVNGMKAVLQNGGRADMTAKEFSDMVLAKYDRAEKFNKENPGKAIDLDKLVGAKPRYEAPMMLRGGPRQGELAPPLTPPKASKQPGGQAAALTMPPPVPAKIAPPAALAAPPTALRPVSDIQSITIRNELQKKDKKPYAPGADTDAAMLTVLKSMDKSLKDMGKDRMKSSPAGGPVRAGGKPPVSGHPTMAGAAADFANDRR